METSKPLGQEQHTGLLVRWPHEAMKETWCLHSSFHSEDPAVRRWLLAVWEGECERAESWIGREFNITDWIIGPCTMVDEATGEEQDGLRTLFLGTDHPPIAFVAKAATDFLRKLHWTEQRPAPWDPPIVVRLKQVSGRGGRRTYKFVMNSEKP